MDSKRPPAIDYRAFLESTPLVPWELDPRSGRISYVGPQAVDFLGYPLDTWLDLDFWRRHVLPDDQAALETARAALLESEGSHVIYYRMEHADGRVVWVSEAASAVHECGTVCCLRGLLSDVTEKKRLEESLARSEERLRGLLRAAPDPMIFTEADGSIINLNDQATYLLGYSLDEVRGSSIDLLAPERLRARMFGQRAAFDRDPQRRTLIDGARFFVQHQEGHEVPVELSISLVEVGPSRQLMYALRDLTARQRVEDQLEASERRLRSMGDALPGLVAFVDADEQYRFVNQAYALWAGLDREEMKGKSVREVLGETVYATIRPSIQRVLAGEEVSFRADVGGIRGGDAPVDISYVPLIDGETVTGYFVIVVSVSPTDPPSGDVHDLSSAASSRSG